MARENFQEDVDNAYRSFSDLAERRLYLAEKMVDMGHYEWEDRLREGIEEEPLCVDPLVIYPLDEEMEFQVLLSTGGPASRIRVRTNFCGEPLDAWFEFQDWFTEWTQPRQMDRDMLTRYVSKFYWFWTIQEIMEPYSN